MLTFDKPRQNACSQASARGFSLGDAYEDAGFASGNGNGHGHRQPRTAELRAEDMKLPRKD